MKIGEIEIEKYKWTLGIEYKPGIAVTNAKSDCVIVKLKLFFFLVPSTLSVKKTIQLNSVTERSDNKTILEFPEGNKRACKQLLSSQNWCTMNIF